MNKRIIAAMVSLAMILALIPMMSFAATANPTASTVLVDGQNVAFDAYNIADNNYFKLRDLAYTLNGTAKQFEVGWDGANNAISLTSGQPYTVAGGEMTGKGGGAKEATLTDSRIYLDGREVQFTAYNIEGNNYFKLRDVGEAFNFGVDWDGARNTIVIDTSKGYDQPGVTTLPAPVPTQTPEPVVTPTQAATGASGGINPAFVGPWRGVIGNNAELYIDFRVDGTFSQHLALYTGINPSGGSRANELKVFSLIIGKWSESDGTVYKSQQKRAGWEGLGYDPKFDLKDEGGVSALVWENIEDSSMRFSEIHDPDEHTIERHVFLLGVSGTQIYHSPNRDITLVISNEGALLKNEPLPSWLYMGQPDW